MASNGNRNIRAEFQLKNFGFDFTFLGESKLMFVQSKVNCISPVLIFVYRLLISCYLTSATVLSISDRNSAKWILYMSSINYILVLVYFVYGFSLTCQSVFCKISFCRGENKLRNKKISEQHRNLSMTTLPEDSHGRIMSTNSNGIASESTSRLAGSIYSVDSIILDIEENCNKRVSIFGCDNNNSQSRKPIESRVHPMQSMQSIQSDVFIEPITTSSLLFKFYWFISVVALNLSVLVTLVYWILLYPDQESTTPFRWYLRIDRHLIVLLCIIIDHVIVKTPIRVLHFIYPSVVFFLYGILNGVYTKLAKEALYSMLDFEKELLTSLGLICLSSFIAIPLIQFGLYWIIYRTKEKVFGSSSIDR